MSTGPGSEPEPIGGITDSVILRVGAGILGLALTGIWTWWALAQGAFFGTALYPGSILLYAVLILALFTLPLNIRSGGVHEAAILAMLTLALWTLVSLAWTTSRGQALDDVFRTFSYGAAMFAGLWFANLLRRRMLLSALPLLAAGAITALVTVITVLGSSPASVVDPEATLDFPLGYRNANAGFFAMVALGALALAAHRRLPSLWRSACAALTTLGLALALVSQSRGATLAAVIAVVVLLAVSAERRRILILLVAVALPLAVAMPLLLEPFDVGADGARLATALDLAMVAAVLAALATGLLTAWAFRFSAGVVEGIRIPTPPRWAIVAAAAAVLVVAGIGAVNVGDRIESGASGDVGYTEVGGSRLTYTGGLNRSDFWRVAWDQFKREPLLGEGAGSFRAAYLLDRRADEQPRDAHGIPFELAGELGAPGVLAFAAAIALLVVGGYRSRRLGPDASTLSSVGAAVGALWLVQGSIDWSWSYPALTAPALALAAAASAPAALSLSDTGGRERRALAAILGAVGVLSVPIYVSERNTTRAAAEWRQDPRGAYDALDLAASLNPLTATPLLVKAEVARLRGDRQTALTALDEGRKREPDDWRNYFLAARTLAPTDSVAALREAMRARELNPKADATRGLVRRLERQLGAGRG